MSEAGTSSRFALHDRGAERICPLCRDAIRDLEARSDALAVESCPSCRIRIHAACRSGPSCPTYGCSGRFRAPVFSGLQPPDRRAFRGELRVRTAPFFSTAGKGCLVAPTTVIGLLILIFGEHPSESVRLFAISFALALIPIVVDRLRGPDHVLSAKGIRPLKAGRDVVLWSEIESLECSHDTEAPHHLQNVTVWGPGLKLRVYVSDPDSAEALARIGHGLRPFARDMSIKELREDGAKRLGLTEFISTLTVTDSPHGALIFPGMFLSGLATLPLMILLPEPWREIGVFFHMAYGITAVVVVSRNSPDFEMGPCGVRRDGTRVLDWNDVTGLRLDRSVTGHRRLTLTTPDRFWTRRADESDFDEILRFAGERLAPRVHELEIEMDERERADLFPAPVPVPEAVS